MTASNVAIVLVEKRDDGTTRQRWGLKSQRSCRIGRMPGATDLVIAHPSMSRIHAVLTPSHTNQYVTIEDLNSSNGTYVNGTKIGKPFEIEVKPSGNNETEVRFAQNPCRYSLILADTQICAGESVTDLPVEVSSVPPSKQRTQNTDDMNASSSSLRQGSSAESPNYKAGAKKFVSKWEPVPGNDIGDDCRTERMTDVQIEKVLAAKRARNAAYAAAAAAAAARPHEKFNVEASELSEGLKQKKKMLWGGATSADSNKSHSAATRPKDDTRSPTAPTSYHTSFAENRAKRAKFLKLLGDGAAGSIDDQNATDAAPSCQPVPHQSKLQTDLSFDLELQYMKGLRRKDGRKDGLGT